MKHLSITSWLLSAIVLLCGCGGYQGGAKYQGSTGGGGGGTSSPPPSSGPSIAGNWQFSTTSTMGMSPATIAGGINQSGSTASGAVHVEGSKCFDHLTTIGLTGTLKGSDLSLTSASVRGQVITLSGSISDIGNAFTGTYTIHGGCAAGDHGTVTGRDVGVIRGLLSGTFTSSGGETFDMQANINAGHAGSEGSSDISGPATFGTSCFASGEILAGTFPTGSFMIGTSVVLVIQTSNGTFIFIGTEAENDALPEISGTYTVTGGTCDQTGTALLHDDPWGY